MTRDWNLPALRESTYPTPEALLARRSAGAPAPQPETAALESGVTVEERAYAGVSCVVCAPRETRRTALYLHGGGYRLGSAARSAAFGAKLATLTDTTVVVAEYRLAPEHPFPAGLHDAASVYGRLLDEGDDGIVVIGDSAGGGLAAALTVAAADSAIAVPRALVLMSAWLDLSCTASTFQTKAETDQLFSHESATEAAGMYLQGHDPADPLVSPLLAQVDLWPPCLVFASTAEVLLDDSIELTSRLARAGVAVTAHFEPGVPHAWPAVFADLPATSAAIAVIGAFLRAL